MTQTSTILLIITNLIWFVVCTYNSENWSKRIHELNKSWYEDCKKINEDWCSDLKLQFEILDMQIEDLKDEVNKNNTK